MKIITRYDPKPIPLRQFDWEAREDDTEGVIGFGPTEEEAVADLKSELEIRQ